ncbi:hypothetical protein B296_00043555 [Ensete ventricosum]|uniref:Uncharacterized protein n=1 Tax=Ensete ventricosum TaxID=4639 RepID=A0A426YQ63_ENSVE|nr:hypothetical protein B296_00043555 [Ensete ventricosum]
MPLRNRARSSAASTSRNRFSGIQVPVFGSLIQKTPSLVAAPDSPSAAGTRDTAAAAVACDRRLRNTKKNRNRKREFCWRSWGGHGSRQSEM